MIHKKQLLLSSSKAFTCRVCFFRINNLIPTRCILKSHRSKNSIQIPRINVALQPCENTNQTYLGESQVQHSFRSQVLQAVFPSQSQSLQQHRQRDGVARGSPVQLCYGQQHPEQTGPSSYKPLLCMKNVHLFPRELFHPQWYWFFYELCCCIYSKFKLHP